jgi:hypothetical protein
MCVTVEGEDAPGRERASGQRVIEILPGWIAVDLDRDTFMSGAREDRVPVSDDSSAGSRDATTGVRQDMDVAILNRGSQPLGLIVGFAKL